MSWNNDQNSCAVYSFRKHRKIADDRPVSTRYRSVSPGRTCRSTISGSGQQETFRRSSRFCHIEVGRGVLRTVANVANALAGAPTPLRCMRREKAHAS